MLITYQTGKSGNYPVSVTFLGDIVASMKYITSPNIQLEVGVYPKYQYCKASDWHVIDDILLQLKKVPSMPLETGTWLHLF